MKGSAGGRHGLVLEFLIPTKSLAFIPCTWRPAGFQQAGGYLLGRGSQLSTACAPGHEGNLTKIGENPLAPGGNSISRKTWGASPNWCREFAFEQQYPEPFTFQGAAIQTERLWPNSSCPPLGVICAGEDCQLLCLPHCQTMYPAGKLFLACLLLFDLTQDQDPLFIPGQFTSLSPIPHLFPSLVSITSGWS